MTSRPGLGLPPDVSVHGHLVDALLRDTLIAVGAVFAVVLAAMVWAIARHRGRPALHSHGSRASIALLVAAVALIAALVDGSLVVRSLRGADAALSDLAAVDRDPRTVRIEVSAHQWAWLARYPGPDGRFASEDDIVALNEIRIPVATPILVQLAATDVVHSFSLPSFRVKQDAVPGAIRGLAFEARVPGEYEIACAQHCGPNHYAMRGLLTVVSAEDYAAWLEKAGEDARLAYDPADPEAQWGWPWRSAAPW